MPRGMTGVRDVIKDIEARKAGGGGGGTRRNWLKIGDGESVVVRFLEQGDEVKWAWCHEVPVEGRSYGRPVPCRDQDDTGARIGERCPGCEQQLKRKFQGWINVIWRGAPVYETEEVDGQNGKYKRLKKDASGNFIQVGTADQVGVWQSGIVVFEELDGKDVTYKGLRSRDFRITRRGQGMNTKYAIEPADPDAGPQEMSDADKKLAQEKYDLTADVTPPSYESWGKEDQGGGDQKQGQAFVPADVSPFAKRA